MIEKKWEELQNKLEDSRSTLSHYHDLMSLFADMDDCLAEISQIQVRIQRLVCRTSCENRMQLSSLWAVPIEFAGYMLYLL